MPRGVRMATLISGVDREYAPETRNVRELDVTHLGRRIRQHRWWVLGPALLCFIGSAIFVNVVSPRYTGETKILVENQENYFTRPDKTDNQAAPLPDDEAVQSQVQLVSSRDIAREAIRQLNLQGNPEFDPLADGIGPITRLLVLLGLERDPLRVPPEERILTRYFDRLTVFPVTKSRVLTVEFDSKDPDLAARAANTISDIYIDVQSNAKRDAARAAADSLRTLIADLRVRAGDAESKAQALRNTSGLLTGANNTALTSQQLTDLSTQLAQAHSAEADAQSRSKLIRDLIKSGRLTEVTDVANNDLIRRLLEQRANVQAELALQARTLLPGHPRMQELTAQLGDLDRQLRATAEKAARTLDNDARIAAGRVENLTAAMNSQKAAIGASGTDQVKLSELELNARLLKDQLEFNTAKYQEAVARENAGSTPADARIVSRAVAPQVPTFPKKWPIIAIATIAGLLLSLGVFIARELLSGRSLDRDADLTDDLPVVVRTQEPPLETPIVEEHVVPVTAHEPEPRPDLTPIVLSDDAEANLRSTVHEEARPELHAKRDAFLTLLDEVLSHKVPEQALRVLICNGDEGDSAARTALRLGRILSRSFRTIAVDLSGSTEDLALHRVLGNEGISPAGLSDLLEGDSSFAEVIHRDAQSRLHFVPRGTAKTAEDDEALANVLDALAQTYDFALTCGPQIVEHAPSTLLLDHADVAIVTLASDMTASDFDRLRERVEGVEQAGPSVLFFRDTETPAVEEPRFGVAAA